MTPGLIEVPSSPSSIVRHEEHLELGDLAVLVLDEERERELVVDVPAGRDDDIQAGALDRARNRSDIATEPGDGGIEDRVDAVFSCIFLSAARAFSTASSSSQPWYPGQ